MVLSIQTFQYFDEALFIRTTKCIKREENYNKNALILTNKNLHEVELEVICVLIVFISKKIFKMDWFSIVQMVVN